MTIERQKECYCYTCDKPIHSLGVARHRAMHRDKKEECQIMYADGRIADYDFRSKNPTPRARETNSPF